MKKWLSMLLFTVLAVAGCSGKTADNEKEVDSQSTVDEDVRIIAGTVVIADIMDRLELDAIAIPETSKQLPERFDGLPNIGNAMEPDMEIVKSLNPTEVLSVSTLEYDLKDKFEGLKVPVDFVDLSSVEKMLSEITEIGAKYHREKQAALLVEELQTKLDEVELVASEHKKPSVLILLGVPGSYLVATEHSYAGDLARIAGAENVMAGQDAEYLGSNTEYLYEANPDIILRLAHGMPKEVIKMFDEEFATNDVWKHFDAVKNGRVYDLEEELFGTTAALNVPEALNTLVDIFYHQ